MQRERPKVGDVDPDAMSVDATPDEVRNRGDQDETEVAQVGDGALAPVQSAKNHHTRDDTDASERATPDDR